MKKEKKNKKLQLEKGIPSRVWRQEIGWPGREVQGGLLAGAWRDVQGGAGDETRTRSWRHRGGPSALQGVWVPQKHQRTLSVNVMGLYLRLITWLQLEDKLEWSRLETWRQVRVSFFRWWMIESIEARREKRIRDAPYASLNGSHWPKKGILYASFSFSLPVFYQWWENHELCF